MPAADVGYPARQQSTRRIRHGNATLLSRSIAGARPGRGAQPSRAAAGVRPPAWGLILLLAAVPLRDPAGGPNRGGRHHRHRTGAAAGHRLDAAVPAAGAVFFSRCRRPSGWAWSSTERHRSSGRPPLGAVVKEIAKWCELIAAMLLACDLARDRGDLRTLMLGAAGVFVLEIVLALALAANGVGVAAAPVPRLLGTFGQPNPFGSFMAMGFAFALPAAPVRAGLDSPDRSRRGDAGPGGGVLFSFSRGSWDIGLWSRRDCGVGDLSRD